MIHIDEKIYLWFIAVLLPLLFVFVVSLWRKKKAQRAVVEVDIAFCRSGATLHRFG